jgi:hypothetical protein
MREWNNCPKNSKQKNMIEIPEEPFLPDLETDMEFWNDYTKEKKYEVN